MEKFELKKNAKIIINHILEMDNDTLQNYLNYSDTNILSQFDLLYNVIKNEKYDLIPNLIQYDFIKKKSYNSLLFAVKGCNKWEFGKILDKDIEEQSIKIIDLLLPFYKLEDDDGYLFLAAARFNNENIFKCLNKHKDSEKILDYIEKNRNEVFNSYELLNKSKF